MRISVRPTGRENEKEMRPSLSPTHSNDWPMDTKSLPSGQHYECVRLGSHQTLSVSTASTINRGNENSTSGFSLPLLFLLLAQSHKSLNLFS
jgi:hypothetical protein